MTHEQVNNFGTEWFKLAKVQNKHNYYIIESNFQKYARDSFGRLYLHEIYMVQENIISDNPSLYYIAYVPGIIKLDKGFYPEEYLEVVYSS